MATVSGGQVILTNGQRVTPQTGGWYDGQQFWNGTLSNPGQFNTQNNQPGQKGGAAPVQNNNDAAYLARLGDTNAPNRVVNQPGSSFSNPGTVNMSSAAMSPGQAPAPFDLIGTTNAAYNSPEILAANKAIQDATTELTTRQQALAEAQAGINDNPFYSEATRVGKSQQLTQQANNDMTVIQNKINSAQGQSASLKSDAAIKVAASQGQYNINRQAYQDTLSEFNNLLASGAFTNISSADLANIAVQTGIPVSELQSIQKAQQDKNVTTSLITSDNGSISVINSKTGEVISQTQPGLGPVSKTGSNGLTPLQQTNQNAKQVNNAISILGQQDTINTGGKGADYQLSQTEKQNAFNQVLALVGGDTEAAKTLFAQAWSQAGYSDYTPKSSGSNNSSNGSIPIISGIENWWNSL